VRERIGSAQNKFDVKAIFGRRAGRLIHFPKSGFRVAQYPESIPVQTLTGQATAAPLPHCSMSILRTVLRSGHYLTLKP
jgi:hypothetical protein